MSRTTIVIAVIVLIILAVIGALLPDKIERGVSENTHQVASHFWGAFGWVKDRSDVIGESLETLEELESRARKLSVENVKLKAENELLRGFKKENDRLREMVGFKKASNFRLLACRVVERDPSTWRNMVTINRGWDDEEAKNLRSDQPVVSPRGIVGKTGVVGRYTTKVILLIDENCKISGVTENSRARGIVIGGTPINGGKPICRMTFISRDADLAVGERVFTTGLGGTFPPNLFIGVVSEAPPLSQDRNFGLFRDGSVDPAVNLDDLEEMFVVIGVN